MKGLILAVGFFAATFVVTAACKRKERSRVMTFRELYEDNDVKLDGLLDK